MFYEITIYQDRARTQYNFIVRSAGRIIAADIGFPTEATARAWAMIAAGRA